MTLPTLLVTIAGDLLPVVTGIPLGNTLAESVTRLIDGRRRKARDILIEELSQGRALIESVAEVDELAAIFLKYMRAAEEGTARLNLRLMAMTIRGMTHNRVLTANRFLYYAGFLATLSREEVIAIATPHKNEKQSPDAMLSEEEARGRARARTREELVPAVFPTERHLNSALQAATRTGLVVAASGWDMLVYETTPLMDEVASLAPFRDALERESEL
jgi:hypothetical protein